tara:strand:- start:1006 stop:2745 length:1740 start_codon:yes stop_codon:yes gene_type:complete
MKTLENKAYHSIIKELSLKNYKVKKKIKLLSLCNFNDLALKNYIKYHLKNLCIEASFLNTEYAQTNQKIYSKNFFSKIKNVNFIIIGEDINAIEEIKLPLIKTFLDRIKNNILYLINNFDDFKLNNIKLIVLNAVYPKSFYLLNSNDRKKYDYIIKKFNADLEKLSSKYNNIKILDNYLLSNTIGLINYYDFKNYHISKILFSETTHYQVSLELKKIINFSINHNKKCLVVDLDNTMWGGVLGETDKHKIETSGTYKGECFKLFQKYLKMLSNKGILLGICSKNNYTDVVNLFKKNKELAISLKNFQSVQINWDHKFLNIRKIAKDLNIGLDSFVFFDDSPLERAEMKKFNPEVTVLDFPKHPEEFIRCIEDSGFFYTDKQTKEDKRKKIQYKMLKKIEKFKSHVDNIFEFRKNLKMSIEISEINKFNFDRCCQMINKINQFNLRTKRLNESELASFMGKKNNYIYLLKLKDRFGDHGVTALIMLKSLNNNSLFIENYLLSCRILGRDIEYIFLEEILKKIKIKKINKVVGQFLLSKKNQQCENFYKKCGFEKLNKKLFFFNLKNRIKFVEHNVKIKYV